MRKNRLVAFGAIAGSLLLAASVSAGTTDIQPAPQGGDYYYGGYYDQACGMTLDGKALQGDDANDKITGSAESDLLRGGGGNDKIKGAQAADCLFGQRGGDKLRGDSGGDVIRAGRGKDTVKGKSGDDDIRLQDGADKVKAGSGNDSIKAQGRHKGVDKVNCGSGKDKAIVDHWDKVDENCEKVKVVQQ